MIKGLRGIQRSERYKRTEGLKDGDTKEEGPSDLTYHVNLCA